MQSDESGFQCVCGEWVVQMHSDCRSLMTRDEYERYMGIGRYTPGMPLSRVDTL